ncbi:MAG: hypothetical protein ACI8WB_003371 [Phenylobacterium sp.]|jgi:hypothetical protein
MSEVEAPFCPELFEKLIPDARKPVSDITIAMLAPDIDVAGKAQLKMALQKSWAQCGQRIDHRELTELVAEVPYGQHTHFICRSALSEFKRQRVLYNQNYTVGLKHAVDAFAKSYKEAIPAKNSFKVQGWRLNSTDISDFRRNNDERLLLAEQQMKGHKQRNQADVDNTIKALTARSFNMATVAQLNALIVLSNRAERYHLLISQGHTLSLQAELLIDQHLIPHMVENTVAGDGKLFLVWANSQHHVHTADLQSLAKNKDYQAVLKTWAKAVWHKAFLVKTDALDPELADMGTSLPANVSAIVDKLNAPLPLKVAKLSKELAKIALIEDVSFMFDYVDQSQPVRGSLIPQAQSYKLAAAKGVLRHVPFNIKELPDFHGTYRFSHDCELGHNDKTFTIVNGHADCREAVISLSLKKHKLTEGDKITISWLIDGVQISLDANITGHDEVHKRVALRWCDEPKLVRHLFKELEQLEAFDCAFKEDIQAPKLDSALRNLVLSNLPKVSIFAHSRRQSMTLSALTGQQHLPSLFVDTEQRVKLDALFTQEILYQLANGEKSCKDILLVAVNDGKVIERRLISDFASPRMMFKVLSHMAQISQLYAFALDMSTTREKAVDDIITIENKYVSHYSPGKAKKLDAGLAFNAAIQLVDISGLFRTFVALH